MGTVQARCTGLVGVVPSRALDNPKCRYPKLFPNSSQEPKFRSVRSQRKTLTQRPERIQNDRDIDRLLKEGAFDN